MKKTISILILLVILMLILEWSFTFLKKGHEVSYKVFVDERVFDITEIYQKENGNNYVIRIENGDSEFYYKVKNNYNKQKRIIEKIQYFSTGQDVCIYPILESGEGTYLQCYKDGILYTSNSYINQNFISEIITSLNTQGFDFNKNDEANTKKINNSTVYSNNLLENDVVTFWVYKGIDTISKDDLKTTLTLAFDKYDNSHGYLVDNYYIIPNYLSSKVLEFSSVTVIDLNNHKKEKLELNYTLSSDTYINGVVDGKLYYTDPSNLLQIEINLDNKKTRLIGSKDIGGQIYNGAWHNANIYDFVSKKVLFKDEDNSLEKYNYVEAIKGNSSYYFYNNNGEVYQVTKNYLDKPILLFKKSGINNFNVIEDTIYFVSGNTLYYYNDNTGLISVLKNNDLQYNKNNRVSIYRKS